MNTEPDTASAADGNQAGGTQRRDLADAERAAAAGQPGSFKDEAMTGKVVRVDPVVTSDDSAIKGLDPEKSAKP